MFRIPLLVFLLLCFVTLHAAEKVTSTTVTDESKDIDSEITNSRLRASTGSKSKYSIQTDFSYVGGSVYKPFGETRPRLSPGPISESNTKLSGNISAKYRFNENNSMNIGTGIGVTTPGYSAQKFQMENPYAAYSNLFGVGNTQHVLSFSLLKYTAKELVEGYAIAYELSFYYTYLVTVGKTGWQTGLVFLFSHEIYDQYRVSNSEETLNTMGLYPFVEYEISPTVSFRTVYRGVAFYSSRKNFNNYVWDEATQSLGLGVTISRDIYLYPNIQWVWRDMRWDKTNVSLVANINFF